MNRPVPVSSILALAVFAAFAAFAPAARANDARLITLVPADAAAVWSWEANPGSERLASELEQVLDAVLDAQFDDWTFEALDALGLPEEVMVEVRGVRNVLTSVGALVPWRELLRDDAVLVRTTSPMVPGCDTHGVLLISRPDAQRLPAIEQGLAGLFGALAGVAPGAVRYDIHRDATLGAPVYQLTLRGDQPIPWLQVAVVDGVLLAAAGAEGFRRAGALLREQPTNAETTTRLGQPVEERLHRLVDSPRFRKAVAELPRGAAGMWYLDVPAFTSDADELAELVAGRAFHAGPWQALLADALELANSVDTLAGSLECQGDRVVQQTFTRFSEGAPRLLLDSLAAPGSGELLSYVPADVIALDMRGPVDLVPAWHQATEHLKQTWGPAENLFWAADVLQAGMDLFLDRDLLPWLGSEHVAMTLPSRSNPSAKELTDTVVLWKLRDRDGAANCLRRVDGVLERVLPKLVGKVQEWLVAAEVPYGFDIRMGPAEGMFRGLRRIEFELPMLSVPPVTYGLMGNQLILTTSERALSGCLDVAAGEADGLELHPLLAGALARHDLCSLSLRPLERELAQTVAMLGGFENMLQSFASQAAQNDPQAGAVLTHLDGLLAKAITVLGAFDFLDEAVTLGTVSPDGHARHETTTWQLTPQRGMPVTPLALGSR